MRSTEVEIELIKTLALLDQDHDDTLIDMFMSELKDYPDASILASLKHCRRTLEKKMYLATIIKFLPENIKVVGMDGTGRFQLLSDGSKRRINAV